MEKKSYFWASYADLMTSLFFIMLILFILTVVMLQRKVSVITDMEAATRSQLDKVKEIENAVNQIDKKYFDYDENHKKHILKIDVSFDTGVSEIGNIPDITRGELLTAGNAIRDFIQEANHKYNVKYLLIIEGQSSKDNYIRNHELSYSRALSLVNFWRSNQIVFDENQCEVIISGSGQSGALRAVPDIPGNKRNQRFLIHIIPKPGVIDNLAEINKEKGFEYVKA
ncbi:MAG: hypothetical protein ACRCUJ_09060 [Phocaeicola sp.]